MNNALNSPAVLDQLKDARSHDQLKARLPNIAPHHMPLETKASKKKSVSFANPIIKGPFKTYAKTDNQNMLQELDNVMENLSKLTADIEHPPTLPPLHRDSKRDEIIHAAPRVVLQGLPTLPLRTAMTLEETRKACATNWNIAKETDIDADLPPLPPNKPSNYNGFTRY